MLFSGHCKNVQAADIVFLIDGSSSIGRANFQQVKGFLTGIAKPFASSVSASGIRFGAIQYSDNSRWLRRLTHLIYNKGKCMRRIMCSDLFCSPGLNLSSTPTWMAQAWSKPYRTWSTRVETHAPVPAWNSWQINSSTLHPVERCRRCDDWFFPCM